MDKKIKLPIAVGLALATSTVFAATVNPYTHNNIFKNAIKDAKWQRGYNSEQQCRGTGCSNTMGSSSNLKYVYVDSKKNQMYFTTSGSKDEKWRSELRFNASFNRGSSRTMTARLGYWKNRSTSSGFTVAQLHMEQDDNYKKVNGPPARLEIVDEKEFEVVWRKAYDCSSNCWTKKRFSTSTSGWKDIQLQTSGNYINVKVAGQTHSYNLKGSDTNWPSKGGYYWKTGIYLQDEGTAFTGYKNIYW